MTRSAKLIYWEGKEMAMEKPLGTNRGRYDKPAPPATIFEFHWHCGGCFAPSEREEGMIEVRGTMSTEQATGDALKIAKTRHRAYRARCRTDVYVRIRLHKAVRPN